ncbi:Gfo/Idh/MocA family protein [Pseudoroseicyclus aestuarii]|uniref:Putative dehydrogenase n=1 Tax=Pseudoroseicyclus aestuarii TaxID=1795041 RepID=A0A318T8K8_9RHOB|nr:Gfo/Idh/MocA family oxidoreductase [Pseudoroseicyclus aestuarii]PYE84708.1 putative dehydrogenase [Pseudoroseicyclus aestuarii]
MSALGVGIIGCGNISAAYLRLAPLFKDITVKAVADINPEAAKARAEEFGVRAETVEDILAAQDVDVIVNLTVPAAHYELTRRILEAGKHAYSEKPLVLELDQAKALQELADAKNLRIGSAPDTFLGGAHQAARRAIDDGTTGRILGGTCHVMSRGMEHWHPNPDFFFLPGAGPVLDIGPYYVTNLIQLIGPVKAVTAMSSSAWSERTIANGARTGEVLPVKTPTNIHAILEFENGAVVTLGASWDIHAHRHANMELYGENASLYVPDPNFFGGKVELAGPEAAVLDGADHPFGAPNQDVGTAKEQANYRTAGLADMAAAIREGRPHRCSLDLAVHAIDVMTSILKAGEQRGYVEMTTTCERPAPMTAEDARALMA